MGNHWKVLSGSRLYLVSHHWLVDGKGREQGESGVVAGDAGCGDRIVGCLQEVTDKCRLGKGLEWPAKRDGWLGPMGSGVIPVPLSEAAGSGQVKAAGQ